MSETKQGRAESKSTEELKAERQSDATDDETLKETEERGRNLNSENTDRAKMPSPDGELDETEEIKDVGPM